MQKWKDTNNPERREAKKICIFFYSLHMLIIYYKQCTVRTLLNEIANFAYAPHLTE